VKTLIRDRFAIGVVAAMIAIVGVVAFYYPIHLRDYDPWGMQIPCGTAVAPDADQAVEADMYTANPPPRASASGPTQYAAQCNRAVWIRRGWAVPLTLAGLALVAVVAMGRWPAPRDAVSKD
jgi:H+/Cl- antiporter ClcA